MLPIRTILHPTDFSEPSAQALEFACGLAADYSAGLVIMHVVTLPRMIPDSVVRSVCDPELKVIRARLDDLDVPLEETEVTRRIEAGNPAAEILNVALLCRADLIVMGSHGRDGLRPWLMGSVAEAVLCQATCPVLTMALRQPSIARAPAANLQLQAHI